MYKIISLVILSLSVLCEAFNTRDLPKQCNRKGDPGRCLAYIPRWQYNPDTKSCEEFIYGGCGGYVPFYSKEECQRDCRVKVGNPKPEICKRKGQTGPCRAAIPSWQYNMSSGKCETFTYGGCKGFVPFRTSKDCKNTCETRPSKPSKPLPDVCMRKGETGPCRSTFEAWQYDKTTGKCRTFVYGGCKGYVPFKTEKDCQNTCNAE